MAKLTDAHLEQIRSMREDGRTYEEIKTFFRDSYGIKLYDNKIAKLCKGAKSHLKKCKRHRQHRRTKKARTADNQVSTACSYKAICRFADECRSEICKFRR